MLMILAKKLVALGPFKSSSVHFSQMYESVQTMQC